MDKMRFVLLFILFQCFSVSANDFSAPFGLNWGMSVKALNKIGFKDAGSSGGFRILSSVTAPKPWSKGDEYLAVIYKNKLVKIVVFSEKITNDLYGSEGKGLYNKVKSLLAKKYGGPADSTELMGLDIYKDTDEFYQCLKYNGCGYYRSSYKYGDGFVAIQLKGVSRGTGTLKILYESSGFLVAKDEIEKNSQKSDESSF